MSSTLISPLSKVTEGPLSRAKWNRRQSKRRHCNRGPGWIMAAFSLWLTCSGGPVPAVFGQTSNFAERFAVSADRGGLLAELIPGTEEYFFYHALHAQNEARVTDARGFVDAWIQRFGMTGGAKRMLTRQVLLEHSTNPAATAEYLTREFGIQTSHPAPQKDEAAELANQLDPALIDWNNAIQSLLRQPGQLGVIEDRLLPHVLPLIGNTNDLRTWISRIDHADVPGIVDRLAEELELRDSQGFGWARVHRELTLAQLKALQAKLPALLQSGNFVNEMLRRMRVSDDESMQDIATRRKHLEEVEKFVLTLPESHTSLVASVLYQRLKLDAGQGIFERERFLRYLQLPNARPWISDAFRDRCQGKLHVDFNASYPPETLVRTIGNDLPLVESYLEHFFRTQDTIEPFSKYLNADLLKPLLAKTKILYGIGDSKAYYAQLSPEAQRELATRIEVKFSPSNPEVYKPNDRVRLEMELKNTPELLIRIYRLNAKNILSRQADPISTAIDLDGVVANAERRIEYAQRPELRHRESIELPELDGMGVWVVECLAGGQRSRALIHKGHLQTMQTLSDAGHVIRIVNADGERVPTARALLGEREYGPEEDGTIVIPFSQAAQTGTLVLFDGNFAVTERFTHAAEAYELRARFLIEAQSMLPGAKTAVVVRPRLLNHGQPISLGDFEQAELIVTTTDMEGIVSTQTFRDLKFDELEELTQPFLVPPRLSSVRWELRGKIKSLRTNTYQTLSVQDEIAVNGLAKTGRMHDLYLTRTDTGYLLEARGRNGEPCSRIPLQLEFKMYGIMPTTIVRLATNEAGVIDLGRLAGVESFSASGGALERRSFPLVLDRADWPERIQVTSRDAIELPTAVGGAAEPERDLSIDGVRVGGPRFRLLETRSGVPYAQWDERVERVAGGIRIAPLSPGNYVLTDHRTGARSEIWVTEGEERDGMLVGKSRTLMRTGFAPLRLTEVRVEGGRLKVQVSGAGALGRVHVVGTAYEHLAMEGWAGRSYRKQAPAISRTRLSSFYVDSLQLDEEYQYVLARQLKRPYAGSSLAHPSILLNPWELSTTQNQSVFAKGGDDLAALAPAPQDMPSLAKAGADPMNRGDGSIQSYDYDFLVRGAVIASNLRPDANGWIELDIGNWEGLTSLSVVAVHPSMTASRRIGLPLSGPRALRDRRLPRSLDPAVNVAQNERVVATRGGARVDLGDAAVTKVRAYDSIAGLLPVMRTLSGNSPLYQKWDFLGRWSRLSDIEKRIAATEMACHELHLFLYMHDRPFFDASIKPVLQNKTPKQFMDHWLLDQDLTGYLQPWRLQQLNTVERVLLAKRLKDRMPSVRRAVEDHVMANPIASAERSQRFATALRFLLQPESPFGVWGATGSAGEGAVNELQVLEESEDLMRKTLRDWSDAASANRYYWSRNDLENRPGGFGGAPGSPQAPSRAGSAGLGAADAFYDANVTEYDGSRLRGLRSELADKDFKSEATKELAENGVTLGRRLSRLSERDRAVYESLEATRKWAESQFYQVLIANQNASLIPPNAFWLDYLKHEGDGPFLSDNVHLAARTLNDSLLALAVLGLPIESQARRLELDGDRWVIQGDGPAIVYVQGILPVEGTDPNSKLLLSENFYLADADPSAKSLDRSALVAGVAYRGRVVMTNPTGNTMRIQLLMQIPQGAIALEGGRSVTVKEFELAPFSTQETSHVFYFPSAGEFSYYGAKASQDQRSIAAQESGAMRVLDKPLNVDDSSWNYVAAWGTHAQVLESLKTANLSKIDLGLIAWRMSDRAFWQQVLDALDGYGVYHEGLWAYALRHQDAKRTREFLDAHAGIVQTVGPVFRTELMDVQVEARFAYEHLDFRPLVVARSHMLGREPVITNDGMKAHYSQFMQLLAFQPRLQPRHRLALVYYWIANNRIEDAMEQFSRVQRQDFEGLEEGVLQYDYFAAYLDMRSGKYDEAKAIARRYVEYPSVRWRAWFEEVARQVEERASLFQGKANSGDLANTTTTTDATQRLLGNEREQTMQASAASLPSLELVQEGDTVWIESKNLAEIRLNYYLMDVELMFSRNPFLARMNARPAVTEPNVSEVLKVGEKEGVTRQRWVVPAELKNRNLILEVSGVGLVRSLPIYSSSLSVTLATPMGRLQVLKREVGSEAASDGVAGPVEAAYVKVFAKHRDGSIRFYKDGYTDLRGQFDYVSLSVSELQTVEKFAILVLHPEHGAWIRECDPPNSSGK